MVRRQRQDLAISRSSLGAAVVSSELDIVIPKRHQEDPSIEKNHGKTNFRASNHEKESLSQGFKQEVVK